ncbi:50S ribosomal protein L28 [candidate division WOR-3 bacterium]|nr:50S ribosomal protein L28 [candidate division WOR-3 bacterium]
MARKCAICGKRALYSSKVSHSHRVTKHKQLPNLQSVRAKIDGKVKRILICAKCLKANKVEIATRSKA